MASRVALITGSATGIGRATAAKFARAGFGVVVNYSRSEAEAKETLEEVKKCGVPALLVQANVADEAAVRGMFQRVRSDMGGLDILINNAAMTHFIEHANLAAATASVWDEIFNVNVKGLFFCCREAMPLLQERGGCIVNVSSVAGLAGHGSSIPYAASKAAVNSITKSLARAFAPKVRVNAVAPGPVLTRWLKGREAMIERSMPGTPMGRAATPEDIADVVHFLALETSLMTGQVVIVDGGRTM
jgi:3-oxoacyl-[acyl-carrier protein] reductase